MVGENIHTEAPRGLLGLRAPTSQGRGLSLRGEEAGAVPTRPDYNIISSGRDSEEDGSRGQTSDLMTALGAGAVLVLFLVAIGLLLN